MHFGLTIDKKARKRSNVMVEKKSSKRLIWILSLLLGPVAFFVLLIASPETPAIDEITQKLSQFVFCFIIFWIIGLGLVWGPLSPETRPSETRPV